MKFSWSWSALNSYETCPRRHYETKIAKNFQEVQGPQLLWGNQVHAACEKRLFNPDYKMPEGMESYAPMVDQIRAAPGDTIGEGRLALDEEYRPCDWRTAHLRGIIDVGKKLPRAVFMGDYKGLPLDTPLPTPTGFTTMGEVQVGEQVLASDGAPCTVTAKSGVYERPCFRIHFDDKTSVVCDNVHLWPTLRGVVPVTELEVGDRIALALPAQHSTKELPIDPYVFGLWLADGKRSSAEVTKPDEFIWLEIQRRGYELGERCPSNEGKCPTHTVKGIRGHLTALGVLRNKHIPQIYLEADVQQRTDLLRGLMDGDGSVNPTRSQAVFTTTNKRLSDGVKQLAESLGQRVNQATTTQHGFGKTVEGHPVAWRPRHGLNPFLLPRKAEKVSREWERPVFNNRRVTKVERVPARETQCIAVDSPDRTYLCTRSYIPTHNTGKKDPNSDQLLLSALIGFHTWRDVEKITTAFIWLQFRDMTTATFQREEMPSMWNKLLPRVERMKESIATNRWEARPSGLCKKHCPVTTCPHNGSYK